MIRWLVVACVACGSPRDAPREDRAEIPCDDVARHAAKLNGADATRYAKLCDDGWSRQQRVCVRAAATKRELDDCDLQVPPQVEPAAQAARDDAPATRVALTAAGEVFVNGDRVTDDQLERRLASLPKGTRVLIAADKNAAYATVVKLLDRVKGAGLADVALETAAP